MNTRATYSIRKRYALEQVFVMVRSSNPDRYVGSLCTRHHSDPVDAWADAYVNLVEYDADDFEEGYGG